MSACEVCRRCGAALTERASKELCPACLLREGLADAGKSGGQDAGLKSADGGEKPAADIRCAAPLISPASLPIDFGDYELLEIIARGGMGVVYKARQKSLNRIVALKMLLFGPQTAPEFAQRFRTEAVLAASLQHPNIVAIHDVGVHQGQQFFAMDYVQGPSLARLVGHEPLPACRSAGYVKTIAKAVHYAHERGILHRDLKPSNVLIDAQDQPRVTDFGLAKRFEGESQVTFTGQVLGSPSYIPPEQALGKRGKVSRQSDVYALGATLYHLLTGRPPFQGESLTDTLEQVLNSDPVAPRLLNPGLPLDLETICLKCMEKEPARRYASAQAVADELDRFLQQEPILARPPGHLGKAWRWCYRQPVRASLVAALLVMFGLGLTGVLWGWRLAERQRLRADQNAYAADMKLVQHALADNDVGLALRLLDKYRPARESQISNRKSQIPGDLRQWEWRYLWQLCQADPCVRLQTNADNIGTAAISLDGKVLAVPTRERAVAVWDLTTKQVTTELPIHSLVNGLCLSRAGDLLAVRTHSARDQPIAELWDVRAQTIRRTVHFASPVRSMALSPDGTLLTTFDNVGTITLVDCATSRTVTNFSVPPPRHGGAGVLAFSPDGNRLAIGEDYGRIRILNWRTGAVVAMTNLTSAGSGVKALAFSPGSELLAVGTGGADTSLWLWDANSGESRGRCANPATEVLNLAFTPDGQRLASVSGDRTIQIWSVSGPMEQRRLRGHEGEGLALAFLPDGRTLVSGCGESAACFWDVDATHRPSAHARLEISFGPGAQAGLDARSFARDVLDPKTVRRCGFAFTPDGQSVITSNREGSLGRWDVETMRLVEELPALGSNNWGVALSPDGRWLAIGNTSGKANIWTWPAPCLVESLDFPFEWIGFLRFSPSGQFLVAMAAFQRSAGAVVSMKIWRADDWQEVPLREGQRSGVVSAGLSPDDRLLATGHFDGTVKLWKFPSREHELTLTNHTEGVMAVSFSPDGRVLASASWDGSVTLWDLFARRTFATLRGHRALVWSMAFSPDGRRLATGGSFPKDAVKLWDLATQREVLNLEGEGEFFVPVAFSPDGNTVMAASFAGVAHLWRAPSWSEIAAAENSEEMR
ncbi:MAG TPA: protein kinase [Candidatus Paceibacterota bacterium]|nr:protein kinase [Verrucomicrobiota bacterium]HRZ44467.1 protein kinase [Candidatus Paceibacterota bacterium]HRZ55802.1 protein kinase [Candidatus Paceibacterota bacterium]